MFDRRAAQIAGEFTAPLTLASVLLVVAFGVPAYPQTNATAEIRVRLIDGRNGRPITGQPISVVGTPYPAGQKRLYRDATTGPDGYATISVPIDFKGAIIVDELGDPSYQECARSDEEGQNFSLDAIRTTGVVSKNTCKRKIIQLPIPGLLIVYLRPETWCHRMGDFSPCFWE